MPLRELKEATWGSGSRVLRFRVLGFKVEGLGF